MAKKLRTSSLDCLYRTIKVPLPPLAPEDFDLLVRARHDAGSLWSSLVTYHWMIRGDRRPWPTLVQLAKEMTGMTAELGLSLGTQSQNLLFDEFLGAVQAAAESRRAGKVRSPGARKPGPARFPWRERAARDTHWDRGRDAKPVPGGFTLSLAMVKDPANRSGLRRQRPLFIPFKLGIPKHCVVITVHYAVDERRFYLLFKTKEKIRKTLTATAGSKAMGIDLGQIRLAAAMTEGGQSLSIKGRGLRALQQGLNREKAWRRSRIDGQVRGSKNRRKKVAKLARESRRVKRQVHNLLHTVSRRLVDFAAREGVGQIFIGDALGVRTEDVGRRQNQANSDWPTGRLIAMITYKATALQIKTEVIDERGTTRTCPRPGCGAKTKPRGRVFCCASCGLAGHRDAVGAWNICARGYEHTHGRKPELVEESLALTGQKYLTPVGVKGVRVSPAPRNPFRVVRSAAQSRSAASGPPKHDAKGYSPGGGMEQALPGSAVS